jgi:hypothetical protein
MRRLALLLAAGLLAGCASETTNLLVVELTGVVTLGVEQGGDVGIDLHHASQGEGELEHPLGPIESFDAVLGEDFEHVFEYPTDDGEGLVVYAWLDRDGDGVLCTPGSDDEEAGLVEVADFPAYAVDVAIELTAPCEGPEGLFP